MAYIVLVDVSERDAASLTVARREEALSVAVGWLNEGRTGVKIIGDGRIYTPTEFAMTIGQTPPDGDHPAG
jgi:hypothetical protein